MWKTRRGAILGPAAALLVLAGCTSINHLDRYDFDGARLAAEMRTPPAPQLHVDYDVNMDSGPIIGAISAISNIAKANQANHARDLMQQALDEVDVPGILRAEAFSACRASLGAQEAVSARDSDYVLSLHIEEWGIDARSAVSAVKLHIKLFATLYPAQGSDIAWRREVTVDEPARPEMFGVGSIVGSMVTATILYDMTEEDLARGFKELGSLAARKIGRDLEEDLDRARYGS